jgi:hypothetical protein
MNLTVRSLSTLCIFSTAAAVQALDLTPLRGTRQGNEGAPTPVIQFTDGNEKVDYRPPAGWEPSGNGKAVTFFTSDPTSWMKLEVIEKPRSPTSGRTPMPPEDLQAFAAKLIPSGAEKLEFVKMVPSPFTIGARGTNEYIFEFSFYGSRAAISISIIDLNDKERLVMLVSADSRNFERIRRNAVASMFSWSPES